MHELEQRDFLRAHGCHEFQGYYAHKPLPADEFARLQIEMDQISKGPAGHPAASSPAD